MSVLRSKFLPNDGFSPWQAKQSEDEKRELEQFCHQVLPRIPFHANRNKNERKMSEDGSQPAHEIPLTRIRIRRTNTNIQKSNETNDVFERQKAALGRAFSRNKETISQQQNTLNQQKKPNVYLVQPLQQVKIKNLIAEGSREGVKDLNWSIRKKQSSYIMKQKFIQIRRSMNLQLGIWGCISKSSKRHEPSPYNYSNTTKNSNTQHNTINSADTSEKENRFILRLKKY